MQAGIFTYMVANNFYKSVKELQNWQELTFPTSFVLEPSQTANMIKTFEHFFMLIFGLNLVTYYLQIYFWSEELELKDAKEGD